MADQPKRTSRGTFAPGSSGNPTGKPNAAAPPRRTRLDGWTNIFTGHGVYGRDKRQGTSFTAATLNFDQLVELWRGDDLAARAVEVWPKEATRAGWDLTIPEGEGDEDESDRITQITEKLHDLGADVLIRQALATERGMGGAAILIGANDGQTDLTQPLNLAKVRSLDWLTHLEPREIVPVYGYADPRAPKYGQPEIYRIVPRTVFPPAGGTYSQQTIDVHESRLLIFPGIKVSRYQNMTTQAGWGDSVLCRMWRVLRDFNLAWGSAGTLVTTFASGIWKMKDLWEVMSSADGATTFAARLLAMDQAMSTVNATVIDGEDDYHREQTPISGLPDLMDRFATRLAAAADMPLTLLFGTSPAGLNATGESDIRFFYDRVSAYQHDKIEPQLRQLIRILFLCTGSKTEPDKWDIQFRPLWQESSADKAKAQLTQAQADHIWVTDQVVSPEEVAKSHWGTGKWNPDLTIDFDARDAQEAAASGPVRPEDMLMLGRQYTPPPNGPTQASQGTTGPGPVAPPDPNTPPRPIVLTDDAGHRVQLVMGWRRDSDDESQFRADAAKDDVVDQLKDDYGYDDMKWVRDAVWNGPQRVPLDSVDYSGETGWRATQEPDKVEKFQDKIQKGWEKPIILVKRPGHDKYMIADGHHRALAYRNAGRGPLAYVTHTSTNEGPWDTFHDHQRAKRNDSAERFEVFSGWDRYELRPMLVRIDTFNPDETRDEHGEWSGGGAGHAAPAAGGHGMSAAQFKTLVARKKAEGDAHQKAVKAFEAKLKPEERAACMNYSAVAEAVNSSLRAGHEPASGPEKHAVSVLDHAIQKGKAADDMIVYRGIHSSRDPLTHLKPGTIIRDKGYVSTSESKDIAHEFAHKLGDGMSTHVIVRIKVPKGHTVAPIPSSYSFEHEYVLPRGSRFKINSVAKEGNETVVDAEAL